MQRSAISKLIKQYLKQLEAVHTLVNITRTDTKKDAFIHRLQNPIPKKNYLYISQQYQN